MRAALAAAALIPTLSLAQELEPRAYSNAPAGTNFAIAGYTRLSGPVLPSPAIVAVDIDARVNVYTLGYARFTELFGRSANFAIVVPFASLLSPIKSVLFHIFKRKDIANDEGLVDAALPDQLHQSALEGTKQ